jgi:pantetheine-phosphate adenylyltransferase
MTRKAVYAGSFDPITNGHLWMISEGARLFDELIVAIGTNAQKKSYFTLDERIKMLKRSTGHLANVSVSHFDNQFLVNYADSIGAAFVLRGIRSEGDYEYERVMRYVNGDLSSSVSTVFLLPPRQIAEFSSSLVRQLVGPNGWEKVVVDYIPANVFNEFLAKNDGLHDRWVSLAERLGINGADSIYSELISAYRSRPYHNLSHIAHVLREFDEIKGALPSPDLTEIALWFHDFVYDGKSDQNEEESARQAISMCQLDGEKSEIVTRLILCTKHTNRERGLLFAYMSDIDLSIFGQTEERFLEYEITIREEYEWVPQSEFSAARISILERFLRLSRIYSTDHFRDKYEYKARHNLKTAILRLVKKG